MHSVAYKDRPISQMVYVIPSLAALFLLQFLLRGGSAQTVRVEADYCPGLDVDGIPDEWDSCNSQEIELDMLQVGIPGSDLLTNGLRARFAHDGTNIYVLAMIRGNYHLNLTAGNGFSHSVAVMWQVGPSATMFNMGGCQVPVAGSGNPYDCDSIRSTCAASDGCNCQDNLVDIWHIESADPGSIPGVQYPWKGPLVFPRDGSYSSFGYDLEGLGQYQPSVERLFNGNDHTSNSDDEFSAHPCLRADDGSLSSHLTDFRHNGTSYRNQLRYAWSHTAINSYKYPFATIGANGYYVYEFSRPLATNENTDAQFKVGQNAYFAFAFWIPPATGEEWSDANHYVAPASFSFGTVAISAQPNDAVATVKQCPALLIMALALSALANQLL